MASFVSLQPQWNPSNPCADYLCIAFYYVNMAYMNKAFILFPYHTLVLGGGRSRVGWSTEDRVRWYPFLGEVHVLSPSDGIGGFVQWSWQAE